MIVLQKKVEVPESDIQETIKIVTEWLNLHPERDECCPAIFGHDIWTVRRKHIEKDIRCAAQFAHPYHKA